MGFRSKEVNEHNRKTAVATADGKFNYPSSKGLGIEQVSYLQRAPMVAGKIGGLRSVTVKMKDLPGELINDLAGAHRDGNLREELGRHLSFLEKNQIADKGTLQILRGFEKDLLGLHQPDAGTLDCITGVIQSLRPTGGQP